MQNNTVATLIEYVRDLTGQTNASTEKILRALNFAVDHYSYLRITSSGRWKWDSRNQEDLPIVTTTLTGGSVLLENELIAIQHVDIIDNGKYRKVYPIDSKDTGEPLDAVYDGTGIPRFYDYDSRVLNFYPASDTPRTIRVAYSRAHPRYSADNLEQSTGVEPIHEEYIALYAADRLMIGTNDPSRTQVRNELEVKQAEIKDMASKQDRDSARVLKPKVMSAFARRRINR